MVTVCTTTFDSDLLSEQVICMKEIFEVFKGENFLEANDLTEFSKQIIQLLIASKERKADNAKEMQETEDIEED